MTTKTNLEIQIEHYENRVKEATGEALLFCHNELTSLKRRLKNIDKPLPNVSENYKLQARFTGNFYSFN